MTENVEAYEPAPLEVRQIVAPELTELVGNQRVYFRVLLSRRLDDWEQEALRQEQFDDMVRADDSPDSLQFHEWCADQDKLAELIRRTVQDLRERAVLLHHQASTRHRRLAEAARRAESELRDVPDDGRLTDPLDDEIAGQFFRDP